MAPGYAVTKEAGTDRYARVFNQAGFSILAFDFRRFGESGGQPRLVARMRDQLADWEGAIAFGATLPEVDPKRLAIWSYSVNGGQVFAVAARHPDLAGAIAISATVDGPAASRNAMRYQTLGALLRLTGRGLLDLLGGLVGRDPRLVPLMGEPGTVAMLTAPDAFNGPRALDAQHHPEWEQVVAARSALRVGSYRPARYAPRVECPLLVLGYEQDQLALAAPALRAGERAPHAEVVARPGGHFEFLLDGYEDAFAVQISFLTRHLLSRADDRQPAAPEGVAGRGGAL
jgi:pimeloyl-ACP methyl ester carboxylesterase